MKGWEWCLDTVTHRCLFPFKFEREVHEDFMVIFNPVHS